MTSSVVGLGGRSKALPKAKLAPKKCPGHCLVVCCQSTITCWNPAKTITSENYAQQISEMHQKLQCFQPALFNRKGSVLLHDNIQPYTAQPMLQKLNELGYQVLPHPPFSTDLSPTNYHFFKHLNNFFSRKTLPQQAGCRKCFPGVPWIPRHGFLPYRNKQTSFSLAKMCWL